MPRRTALGVAMVIILIAAAITLYSRRSSTSAGPSWRPVGLQGVLVHSIALGHGTSSLSFAGTHGGVYRRRGNRAWQRVLSGGEIWDIELLPDNRTVIAADEAARGGMVVISHDAGAHWRQRPVTALGVYAVSAVPGRSRDLLAGGDDGIYRSQDGGVHWRRRLTLPESGAAAFVWQPGSARVVFAGAIAGGAKGSTQVFRSDDRGITWHVYGRRLNSTGGIMSLAAPPNGDLLAGTMGNAVWHASPAMEIWHKSAHGMPSTNNHVAALIDVPEHPRTLFAGTLGHGIFRSDDGGTRWSALSAGLPASQNATTVLSLAYAPRDHSFYAATANGVYELTLAPGTKSASVRSGVTACVGASCKA